MIVNALLAALLVTVGREPLWPEGKMPDAQPHQIGAMSDEAELAGFRPEEHRMPYVEWCEAPKRPNGACLILISGGAYESCSDVGLVKRWRRMFTDLGYQTVNLVYRTPRPKGLPVWQSAWEDGQRAVRLVRSQAVSRGFDPERIGAVGMSAGGNLTCLLAFSSQTPAYPRVDELDDVPCHVNIAVANAPAYATVLSQDGSSPEGEGIAVAAELSGVFRFDEKSCPVSFHHGGDDALATPNASTLMYRELRKRGIPTELHLYADCGHNAWGFDRAVEFLRQMNFSRTLGPEVKLTDRHVLDSWRDESKYLKEEIWPKGKIPDVQTNQCVPYIEWHFPKVRKTRSVMIVYSGGAYEHCSPNGFEVAPMRRYLNERGITVVTLKYRVPRPVGLPKHLSAWQDLQRTIRIVRSRAAEYDLDENRIGIMGSSAGGHLTLMGALSSESAAYAPIDAIDALSASPRWGVAIYPAYVLSDGVDGHNREHGNSDGAAIVDELRFDGHSCPVCFVHGDADGHSAMGSVKCWEKLRSMGIQCDLHTLAGRKHCFQRSASPDTGSYTWMDQVYTFMRDKWFIQPVDHPEPGYRWWTGWK